MSKVFIQIGTNDGNDEFRNLVLDNNPTLTILVEPSYLLEDKIKDNYKDVDNVEILIAAITKETQGEVELHIPKPDKNGVSSNGVSYGDQHFTLLPMDDWGDEFITIKSKSISFSDLCSRYNIEDIEYLQIDTEGYDYEILKSIEFKKYNIKTIKYENWPFGEESYTRYGEVGKDYGKNSMHEVEKILTENGYIINNIGSDTIAIKK